MKLSVHQPAYLPWLGHFNKIKCCDLFVFMDTVQFEKNGFTNRNKIKTAQGAQWLTVAVKHKNHMSTSLLDLELVPHSQWQKKHLHTIALNYSRAPNYAGLYPKLEKLYQQSYERLTELCWDHLHFWLRYLNITTKVVRLSEFNIGGKKSELILNMCRYFNATTYLSGPSGKKYLIETDFARHHIDIEYLTFAHPYYPQLYGDFLPNLAVLDYCMNSKEQTL